MTGVEEGELLPGHSGDVEHADACRDEEDGECDAGDINDDADDIYDNNGDNQGDCIHAVG